MTTSTSSAYNAHFRVISESHNALLEALASIPAESENLSPTNISAIFSQATQLQQEVNALVESRPSNPGAHHLQVAIQRTAEGIFKKYVRFLDMPSNLYSNASLCPCKLEFDGHYYHTAESCFQAQKYTDQPKIMDLFIRCETAEEALALAKKHPMTPKRALTWESAQEDVMMDVLRAKFGQHPEFQSQLVSTGSVYLVCHGSHPIDSDGFDGSGQNKLGKRLMRLRGEYTGAGEVLPSVTYQIMTYEIKITCPFSLPMDLAHHIFLQLDAQSLLACRCVTKPWNRATTLLFPLITKDQLEKICFPVLRILDAKTLGLALEDEEPPMDIIEVLKGVVKVSLHVEGDEGLTYMTEEKGLTINALITEASEGGMEVDIPVPHIRTELVAELGNSAVKATRRVLLMNNVSLESRKKSIEGQVVLLGEINCEMQELHTLLALCVRTYTKYNLCLFRQNVQDELPTFGRTATLLEGKACLVGGSYPGGPSYPGGLYIYCCDDSAHQYWGAGGKVLT